MLRRTILAPTVVALTVLSLAPSARADVVTPDSRPPVCAAIACPVGAVPGGGGRGHGSCPTVCVPLSPCTSESECGAAGECVPVPLCVAQRALGIGMTGAVALGPCGEGGTCTDADATCAADRRCMPRPGGAPAPPASTPTAPPEERGILGCSITSSRAGAPTELAAAALLAAYAARRRRRDRDRSRGCR